MKYVSWLEAMVVEGLTPGKLEEVAMAEENRVMEEWEIRRRGGRECCKDAADQLRKWAQTGLPRKSYERIRSTQVMYKANPAWGPKDISQDLVNVAYRAVETIKQTSHKHEGHSNSVVLRKHWPGRTCQVCGEKTQWGEMVVCGGRRRGEMSNRTGYAHLRCIKHLAIKKTDGKVVHREVLCRGGSRMVGNYPNHTWMNLPNQKVVRGCRLSRQQCINTGGTPTHVMWLDSSNLCESVAFDRKSLKVKEVKKHKVSKYKTKQQRLLERSAAE